jgi:magnesium-transporting ATPase (P-type)
MWNKIYLILLLIAALTMGVLMYLSYSWLGSIADPKNVAANYTYFADISWTFLMISSLVLLVAANALLFKTRQAWALWTSFLYFSVFMILQTFWLQESFFQYKKTNGLADGSFSLGAFVGVMFVALAAIFVFFNQYLVKRMQSKMFPQASSADQLSEQVVVEKDAV